MNSSSRLTAEGANGPRSCGFALEGFGRSDDAKSMLKGGTGGVLSLLYCTMSGMCILDVFGVGTRGGVDSEVHNEGPAPGLVVESGGKTGTWREPGWLIVGKNLYLAGMAGTGGADSSLLVGPSLSSASGLRRLESDAIPSFNRSPHMKIGTTGCESELWKESDYLHFFFNALGVS